LFDRKNNILLIVVLIDVGGNILRAASKTVSKHKENDSGAVIEVSKQNMFNYLFYLNDIIICRILNWI